MNIDEYRALKAQEETPPVESQVEQPAKVEAPVETTTVEATPIEGAPVDTTTVTETKPPEFIEVDGKQVPFEEFKGGYLRQSDYTRKTQELAREREKAQLAQQYYDVINARPDVAKQFAEHFNLPYADPDVVKTTELERKYQDLLLEREVELMSVKYPDFDSKEVLQFAHTEKIDKIENAYLLMKARNTGSTTSTTTPDINSLREQIRQEIMQEVESKVDTGTLIGTGASTRAVTSQIVELTPAEAKVARMMKMSPEEYAKWK